MRILSATEAISPAIARTKLMLFKPFRPGRTWKLAATSYLGGSSTIFFPFPLVYLCFIPVFRHEASASSFITGLIAVVAVMLLVYFVVFYLCTRLRFACFDIVLNCDEFVAPAWNKYGSQAFKWSIFKLVLGTLFFGLLAIPLVPLAINFFSTLGNFHPSPGEQPPPAFFAAIASFYAMFFILYFAIGIFALFSSLLSDFVVPSLALENTTIMEALRRAGRLVRYEPGAVFLYALMKIVIFLAGGMAAGILFYICLFVVGAVAFLLGLLAYHLLNLVHVPQGVMIALAVIAGIALYLFLFFYGMLIANGSVYTVLEADALYFLGGRYPMLGEILDRTEPPPQPTKPTANYLAYASGPSTPPSANEPL